MKKILVVLLVLLLTGCSVEYKLDYNEGIYNEELSVKESKDEIQNNEVLSDLEREYYNKNILVNYNVDTGDIDNSDFPSYFEVYNKYLIDDEYSGIKLSYSFKDDYKDSSIINELFNSIEINRESITFKSIKNIYTKYPYLNNIIVSFKTDRYIKDSNEDEVKDNTYYWYINKDNYKDKFIYIVFTDNKLETIKNISKYKANQLISIISLSIILGLLILFLIIFEKVRKSNK